MSEYLVDEPSTRTKLGNIGRTTFYKLIAEGQLQTVKVGRRRLVLASSIDEYIQRLQSEATSTAA